MLGEFKKFALRGNVLDLAIGVIIRGGVWQDRLVAGGRHHHAPDRRGAQRQPCPRLSGLVPPTGAADPRISSFKRSSRSITRRSIISPRSITAGSQTT